MPVLLQSFYLPTRKAIEKDAQDKSPNHWPLSVSDARNRKGKLKRGRGRQVKKDFPIFSDAEKIHNTISFAYDKYIWQRGIGAKK